MEKLAVTVVVVRTATFREADVNYTETPTATHLGKLMWVKYTLKTERGSSILQFLRTVAATAGLTEP